MIDKLHVPVLAIISILTVSCSGLPGINPDYPPCSIPVADGDWPVSTPDKQGFSENLCALLEEISVTDKNIHSILIERHGFLIAEVYRIAGDNSFNQMYGSRPFSRDTRFDRNTLHDQRSVTKGITAILAGISRDRKKIDTGNSFLDYFPERKDLLTGHRRLITVKNLLTMSAGLDWEEIGHGPLTSDETPLIWKKDLLGYYMDRKSVSVPGEKFNYSSGATFAVGLLLEKVNSKSLDQLAADELFTPLGITRWEWTSNLNDKPMPNVGLRLRPRDMLKIGRLVNNMGLWNGRRIVSKAWITEMISPHVSTGIDILSVGGEPVSYGYQWWTGDTEWRGRKVRWSAAVGNGGQRIYVVPDLDLACVITAGDYGSAEIQRVDGEIFRKLLNSLEK